MKTRQRIFRGLILPGVLMMVSAGCGTVPEGEESTSAPPTALALLPGDDVEISVFGVPELSSSQRIRPDGNLSVKLFGDIRAAGKTTLELQRELTKLYEPQIQVRAITVIARSSAAVYVSGAVSLPGKVPYLRPLTALEAIMEAGGFDQKAGARRGKVRVVRTEDNQVKSYLLDFDKILTKGGNTPFFLKPFDTVYVPGAW